MYVYDVWHNPFLRSDNHELQLCWHTGIPFQPAENIIQASEKPPFQYVRLMQDHILRPTFQRFPAVTVSPNKNYIHCLHWTKLIKFSTHCMIKLHINTCKVVFYFNDTTKGRQANHPHFDTSNTTEQNSLASALTIRN